MKVTIEVDCTPEEARAFMGLPDVTEANSLYVESMTKAMQGATNPAQLQEFAQNLAPMGQLGLKMFQSFVEGGMRGASAFAPGKSSREKDED
ncbi:MAG: DUF6489 family protein [Pseudomonadota bacterium]